MYKAQGVYFDGITSAPQDLSVEVNDLINEISFTIASGDKIVWNISDIEFETYGDYVEIKHKGNAAANLRINDNAFKKEFIEHLDRKRNLNSYQKLINKGTSFFIITAFLIFGLIIVAYVFFVPFVAEKAVRLIPESFDSHLGSAFMMDYLTQNSVDSAKTIVLNEFAAHLDLRNTRELHFSVVDSDIVNAFALPDGNIVIYTALLDKMESYEELAGLIGHEVIHINNRHSIKMLCRNLAGYVFISAILTDVNGIMAIITENAHNLNTLSYSRKFEQEADEEGTALMIHNKIDPRAMLQLFSRLKSDKDDVFPEFMSSHPATDERIKYIDEYIKASNHDDCVNDSLENLFKKLRSI